MNEVENKAIKDQIYFERYKNGEANKVIELIDKSNRELAKYIKQTTDISSKKRYTEIARKLRDVAQNLKEDVESGTDIDGLIDYELKRQKSLLKSVEPSIKKVKGGEVNFLYPSREQIKTAALFKPIDTKTGLTYQSFLEGLENGLYNTWDSALRTGYLTGMPTDEIVDYVVGKASHIGKLQNPGTMNTFRNSVYANTRTMLQSFANETMQRVYEENEKYFGDGETDYKYEYLATLDSRTCIVCGECDGKLYKKLEDCPRIPQHRGCRCVIIPYFNIEGDRRASKDGYVDDKVTYEEWLKKQDEKTQIEVLGKTRYEQFKKKGELRQFVDDGKVVTLNQLNEKVKNVEFLSETSGTNEDVSEQKKASKEDISRLADRFLKYAKTFSIETLDDIYESDIKAYNEVLKELKRLKTTYRTNKLDFITITDKLGSRTSASASGKVLRINKNTFGIAGSKLLSWPLVTFISMTNLTSAGQFAGLQIMADAAGTFIEMAIATFFINLRYSLMAISLSQKVAPNFGTFKRLLLATGITDEIYALAVSQTEPVTARYFAGLMVLPYIGWSSGTLCGAVCGEILPAVVTNALGVALYGMFVAIVVPQMKAHRPTLVAVLIAIACSFAFKYVPALSGVTVGFAIIICALVASLIGAALFPVKDDEEGEEESA